MHKNQLHINDKVYNIHNDFLTNFAFGYKIYYIILYCFVQFLAGIKMIEGYLTIKDIAEKWGVTRRRIQTLCSQGKIEGQRGLGMYG